MINYIIVAGPQSSGKTTALWYLEKNYSKKLLIHPEINQYVLFPNTHLGSIIVDAEMEKKIHKADIKRISGIKDQTKIHLAETDIFHLAYYPAIVGEEFYAQGKADYIKALAGLNVFVIFINTKPMLSFKRRKTNYLNRIKKEIEKQKLKGQTANNFTKEMLVKYQQRIEDIYPAWLRVYREIDFAQEKIMIDNNHASLNQYLANLEKAFAHILNVIITSGLSSTGREA